MKKADQFARTSSKSYSCHSTKMILYQVYSVQGFTLSTDRKIFGTYPSEGGGGRFKVHYPVSCYLDLFYELCIIIIIIIIIIICASFFFWRILSGVMCMECFCCKVFLIIQELFNRCTVFFLGCLSRLIYFIRCVLLEESLYNSFNKK